jgi:uroporphyrinogen decarboxylase
MTPREMVQEAIAHREPARVPYAFDVTRETREYYAERHGIPDVYEWLNNDVEYLTVPWWGWHELGPDWRGSSRPRTPSRVAGTGSYDGLRDGIRELRSRSDRYFLVRIYGSHFEKANSARGIENFLADIGGDPEFARSLLGRIVDRNLVMLENILSIEEIDGVLLGSDWGSQQGLLMSPGVWEELIRPGEQREYDLIHAHAKDVWVHSCGNIEPLLPRLVDMGLDVLNPIQPECMDIAMLKERWGHCLTFWGGVSTQRVLPFGTPREVRREARQTRKMMGLGGGYVFSPAQEIQRDVPLENLEALLEVAREP